MNLLDFYDLTDLDSCTVAEKAANLCYFHYKESGKESFKISDIIKYMEEAGFNRPNPSRLKADLTAGRKKTFVNNGGTLEFIPIFVQKMDAKYDCCWEDNETIESKNEVLDEEKFCGKRGYLDSLIHQINCTYANNCYDACAVLMRRLFEIMLILSYENLGIGKEIKDSSGQHYILLDGIVKNAIRNSTLNLSRIKTRYDDFRKTGNFSAHGITYTASKKDIDYIRLDYRAMLEELYCKSGLTT